MKTSNSNQDVIAPQTIVNYPAKITVVKVNNVVDLTLFKMKKFIENADMATLKWMLAELKSQTNNQ